MRNRGALLLIGVLAYGVACAGGLGAEANLWSTHVLPILSQNCFKCHSELKQKGGLDLGSIESILKGGERGAAVVPGKPADSLLFQFIQPGADPHMPPKEHQLTEDEIGLIKHWITSLKGGGAAAAGPNKATSAWESSDESWVRPNAPSKEPPASARGPAGIDFYIREGWKTAKVKAAGRCDDAAFVRRVYFDLAGRIPTTDELNQFLHDRKKEKRALLVDRLLASDDYAQNMAETFNVLLTGKRSTDEAWRDYLHYVFATNRPWNEVTRDLLLARPSSKELRGSVYFLYSRNNNHQSMAEAVAPAFLGVQLNCAQCHNHPLAPEIKQKHYWGLVSFLNRSKNMQSSDGPALAESAIGGFVKFANLKKESQDAVLTFINNKTIPEKRPGDNEKEEDVAEKYRVPPNSGEKVAPVPKFSRREQLAELASRENPLLARAFVNRIWSMLVGRGIVHPADRMDSAHPPSHPDLLAWLARDFEQNGYDVRHLIRTICLSEVYQLDSKWSGRAKPQPEMFACAIEKPVRAEALLRSMLIACGATEGTDLQGLFTDRFPDVLAAESMANLRQALFLSNNQKFDGLLARKTSKTVDELLKISNERARVEGAFVRVLGRAPDREERKRALQFLSGREAERGTRELIWALLTSAEFRFNH